MEISIPYPRSRLLFLTAVLAGVFSALPYGLIINLLRHVPYGEEEGAPILSFVLLGALFTGISSVALAFYQSLKKKTELRISAIQHRELLHQLQEEELETEINPIQKPREYERGLFSVAKVVGFLGVALLISGKFALVLAAISLVFLGITYRQGKRARTQEGAIESVHHQFSRFVQQIKKGIRTIHSHRAEPYILRRLDELSNDRLYSAEWASRQRAIAMTGTEFGRIALLLGLTLAMVSLPVQESLSLLLLSIPVLNAIQELSTFLLDRPENHSVKNAMSERSAVPFISNEVTLRLNQIQVVEAPAKSGKSEWLEQLAGLRGDTSVIDRVAYVEQEPYFFQGTLRENLIFGNPQRWSDTILWQAVHEVGLTSLVMAGKGLHLLISEGGANLTRGERYQIALCRALLLNRPFLVLDEPFLGVDPTTQAMLIEVLHEEAQRKGILIATQNTPSALRVDRLFKMEELASETQSEGGSGDHQHLHNMVESSDCQPQSIGNA